MSPGMYNSGALLPVSDSVPGSLGNPDVPVVRNGYSGRATEDAALAVVRLK